MRRDMSVHAMHAAWCCLVCICMCYTHGRDVVWSIHWCGLMLRDVFGVHMRVVRCDAVLSELLHT